MRKWKKVLGYLSSIQVLSEQPFTHLESILKYAATFKNAYLLKAGHICRSDCFIEKGLLRCFYIKDDHEVCSWFMKDGDVITSGEIFYQQKVSYESIQAVEDRVLYSIEHWI